MALTIIAPAREGLSATITVHEPDCDRRVFVDVVSEINDGDFKTFEEKTDQIYSIAKKQVIVTLVSYGAAQMSPCRSAVRYAKEVCPQTLRLPDRANTDDKWICQQALKLIGPLLSVGSALVSSAIFIEITTIKKD
jgi:hypothetical protein